jgi:hypothetical protein
MTIYFISGAAFGGTVIGLLAIIVFVHIEERRIKLHRRQMAQMSQWIADAEIERDNWMHRAERLENKLRERRRMHGDDDPADAWKKG